MEASSTSPGSVRRGALLRSAILAALGAAVFGLGALPAQEAQAAGLATGIRRVSAVEGPAVAGPAGAPGTPARRGSGRA